MHDKPVFREAAGFEAQGPVPGGTQRRYRNWLRRYDPETARRKSGGGDLLGRVWSDQFFCPVGRAHCPQENSNDPGLLQDPERQGLVYRGYIFFDSAAARRRVKFARKVCGSILRTKDGLLKTVTDWRATTNPAAA